MLIDSLPNSLFKLAGSLTPPSKLSRGFRSVVLIGFARSGKSSLSNLLVQQTEATIFRLDRLRKLSQCSIPAVRRAFCELLLKLYPEGLIIEGDNLCGENNSGSRVVTPEVLIDTVNQLRAQQVEVFMIGNASATVEQKTAAILEYRRDNLCWTSKAGYTSEAIEDLARRSITYSKDLQRLAASTDGTYLEIRADRFHYDIQNAAESIIESITMPPR